MHTCCVPVIPIERAAPRARSIVTSRVNGPRSLISTLTDWPLRGFVTVIREPNGMVRWAAVCPFGLKAASLAVRRPDWYQVATTRLPTQLPLPSIRD